jgi:hypothetical protein
MIRLQRTTDSVITCDFLNTFLHDIKVRIEPEEKVGLL